MANGYPDPAQQPQPQPMFAPGFGQGVQGMFGGLRRGFQAGGQALHPYSNRLLLTGMGLLSRDKDAMGQAMKGMIAGSALDTEDADRTKLNKAIQGLMNDTSGEGILSGISGPERDYLLASPPTLSKVLADRMSPPSAGVNVYAGDYKVPTGYRPSDPNDPSAGVEPIPGGPAEQLPSELAARIGLTNSFLSQATAIKERLKTGGATGIWDRARAGWDDSSEQATLYRQIESGADALTRMLTGAGMRIDEAQTYSRRYLPTFTDDNLSAAKKLDQLVQELESMKKEALRGRGGANEPQSSGADLKKQYGLE